MDLSSEFSPCHTPVMPEETLKLLGGALLLAGNETGQDALFVDGTMGEGGHTALFLRRFPRLRVIGVDADREVVERARIRLAEFGNRIVFHTGWADDFFRFYPVEDQTVRPSIILMDLGVSLFHYEKGGRGFSFRKNESLDMRIDTGRGRSAAALIAALNERDLAGLLFKNAEERYARRIARAITAAKKNAAITSSETLAGIVRGAVPPAARFGKLHPATKTFQALRIAVNNELERLPELLDRAFTMLNVGGRLGVITFHSIEDRIVKQYFRDLTKDCICPPSAPICVCRGHRLARLITHKPAVPSALETEQNPPSRSAQLRVIEKVA